MGPNLFAYTDPGDMVEAAVRTIEKKTAAALYLYKREAWDCFMLVLGETDGARSIGASATRRRRCGMRISERQGGHCLAHRVSKDRRVLGHFIELAPPDTTIMVMSDHGNGGNSDNAVYLNRWLEREGLLRFKRRMALTRRGRTR